MAVPLNPYEQIRLNMFIPDKKIAVYVGTSKFDAVQEEKKDQCCNVYPDLP